MLGSDKLIAGLGSEVFDVVDEEGVDEEGPGALVTDGEGVSSSCIPIDASTAARAPGRYLMGSRRIRSLSDCRMPCMTVLTV